MMRWMWIVGLVGCVQADDTGDSDITIEGYFEAHRVHYTYEGSIEVDQVQLVVVGEAGATYRLDAIDDETRIYDGEVVITNAETGESSVGSVGNDGSFSASLYGGNENVLVVSRDDYVVETPVELVADVLEPFPTVTNALIYVSDSQAGVVVAELVLEAPLPAGQQLWVLNHSTHGLAEMTRLSDGTNFVQHILGAAGNELIFYASHGDAKVTQSYVEVVPGG